MTFIWRFYDNETQTYLARPETFEGDYEYLFHHLLEITDMLASQDLIADIFWFDDELDMWLPTQSIHFYNHGVTAMVRDELWEQRSKDFNIVPVD